MNNVPIPDELIMFDPQFSLRTTWSVIHWFFLAFVISAFFDVFFPELKKEWPVGGRIALVAAEFVPILLFVRDAGKWIRSMDELQRRITVAALFFSVSASFFFFLLWLQLDRAGFFRAVFGPPFWNDSWGISSVAHVFVLLGGFYGFGFVIFRRHYK